MARNIFKEKYAQRNAEGVLDSREIWPTNLAKGKLKEMVGEYMKDVESLVPRNEGVDPRKFAENLASLASRSAIVRFIYHF